MAVSRGDFHSAAESNVLVAAISIFKGKVKRTMVRETVLTMPPVQTKGSRRVPPLLPT